MCVESVTMGSPQCANTLKRWASTRDSVRRWPPVRGGEAREKAEEKGANGLFVLVMDSMSTRARVSSNRCHSFHRNASLRDRVCRVLRSSGEKRMEGGRKARRGITRMRFAS